VSAPHFDHWPPGLPRSLDYPDVPVGALLAGSARRFADRTFIHRDGVELSYAELWQQACRFAHALHAAGIEPGDVVALHMPNRAAYPIAYYGTLLAGATFTPVNPMLPPRDVAFQLADSGAAAVITYGPSARVIAAARPQSSVRLTVHVALEGAPSSSAVGDVGFEDFLKDQPDSPPDVEIDPRTHLAHIAYTGGTTGRSKGVELPHRNVVVNSLQYACWSSGAVPALDADGGVVLDQIGAESEWPVRVGTGISINLTPWFHAMGSISGLNVPVLTGSTAVLHDRLQPAQYLADAERFGVTSMGGAPTLYASLLSHPDLATRDLSTVRGISSGAAPLPQTHLDALAERFPDAVIVEGYGLTEVTMGATAGPSARSGLRKAGSVGLPVFDTEVRLVDPTTGEEVPSGERGEVCIRGPQVMAGYRNRAEDTAAVLDDGWLRTGDIGVLDEDGYLSIVDRTKDMLIYKGYNVYPREIEELLMTRTGVAAAAVVGRPDDTVGELPVAFVVATEGIPLDGKLLMEEVNESLAPYKRLREMHLIEEIPVSAAGKVLKRELRTQL
jgi:long-chain acyl-CoA synthetase